MAYPHFSNSKMQPLREQEVGVTKGREYQVSAWFEVKTPYDEQTGRYAPMQVSQQEAIEEALDTLRSVEANLKRPQERPSFGLLLSTLRSLSTTRTRRLRQNRDSLAQETHGIGSKDNGWQENRKNESED